jgi:hypothetical protein
VAPHIETAFWLSIAAIAFTGIHAAQMILSHRQEAQPIIMILRLAMIDANSYRMGAVAFIGILFRSRFACGA